MFWLYLVVSANFLYATVALLDKYILSRPDISTRAYAFYVGVFGMAAFVFVPFVGFSLIPLRPLLLSLAGGAFFIMAIRVYYKALQEKEVVRAASVTGALIPLFTFVLSMIFLGELLETNELLAFAFLAGGSFLIAFELRGNKFVFDAPIKRTLAALLLAAFFVSMRAVYLEVSFWDGFLWARVGGLAAALFILFGFAASKQKIKDFFRGRDHRSVGRLFFVSKGASALAFLIFNYAILLETPTLVNAFNGLQYGFIFLLAILLAKFLPRVIKEESIAEKKVWLLKFGALGLIVVGFTILFRIF